MKIVFWMTFITLLPHCVNAEALATKSLAELAVLADLNCLNMKITGVCPKPERQPPLGLKIQYWQPEVFVETVKRPGDYIIREYGSWVGPLAEEIARQTMYASGLPRDLPVTSGNSVGSLTQVNLMFNESHVYDFPLSSVIDAVLCSTPPNGSLGIRYLTEMDSLAWRRGDMEIKLPQSLAANVLAPQCYRLSAGAGGQCMKSWGGPISSYRI